MSNEDLHEWPEEDEDFPAWPEEDDEFPEWPDEDEEEGQHEAQTSEEAKSQRQSTSGEDLKRLPSLHNSNLDVDPNLVVYRFSQGQSDNQRASLEYDEVKGRPSQEEEGQGQDDGAMDTFWDWDLDADADADPDDTGEPWRDSYGESGESGDYDWDFEHEEDLEDLNHDENDEDTIRRSVRANGTENSGSDEKGKSKNAQCPQMSKASFRWFERKILAQQVPQSEENLRRKRLLEKCQMLRKVSKPVVTIFGGKPEATQGKPSTESVKVLHDKNTSKHSKLSLTDSGKDVDDLSEDRTGAQTLPEFSEKEWALQNTIRFLNTAGCTSSSSNSYSSKLKSAKEEAKDFRLALYEKQLKRRRQAIGNQMQAPEITQALRRHAERAIWRAVIDNTKPRYPLPRFILPRHQYLKKIQAQFIGPGTYELDVFEKQTKLRQLRLPSSWSGCSSRFPKEKDASSGDGQGVTHLLDPWTTLDAANYKKKYPGTYIPFESTPKNYRGQSLMQGPQSRIPPNAYNIKSPLEEFIKKRTSLRGPYDCYTPSRSVIPYGYYQSTKDEEKSRLGPGSYETRTSLVKEMNDSYNVFKGQFGKADRDSIFGFKAAFDKPLWPRKGVMIPPPGHYEVGKNVIGSDKRQNLAPFMTGIKTKDLAKPELVASDYYYFAPGATWTEEPRGANLASVFHSKTPQIMTTRMTQIRKQRNKAVNKIFDVEGGGHENEVHFAFDESMKHDYALEDCPTPCIGGPKKDLHAGPGYGLPSVTGQKITGKCCGS